MDKPNTLYKINIPADILVNRLRDNGCSILQDYSYDDCYLRNPSNISEVKCFSSVTNNLLDYDSDFAEEYENSNQDAEMGKAAKEGYQYDLHHSRNQMILQLPSNIHIDGLPECVFITINIHSITYLPQIHLPEIRLPEIQDRKLITIKFTDNYDNFGEIDIDVVDSRENMKNFISTFFNHAVLKPIEPLTDGYIAFKHGEDINSPAFGL